MTNPTSQYSLAPTLPLGQSSAYPERYDAGLLCPVPRSLGRDKLALSELPFSGADLWTGYELSWLNAKGKPQVAVATFTLPCQTENLIESKSFKLYLNSLNQHRFDDWQQVEQTLIRDLSAAAGGSVGVLLAPVEGGELAEIHPFTGTLLDDLDIEIDSFSYAPQQLRCSQPKQQLDEQLISHLLKSNCLITSQPDWASVYIHYRGDAIDKESLLRYLIGFRQHNEFHEQCVERIFCDIMQQCQPQQLTVYARYTRRGGLDINPFRSNFEPVPRNLRMLRQ